MVCNKSLLSFLNLHLSKCSFHLETTCSFTNSLTFCDNSCIWEFHRSVERCAFIWSVSFVALVRKYGRLDNCSLGCDLGHLTGSLSETFFHLPLMCCLMFQRLTDQSVQLSCHQRHRSVTVSVILFRSVSHDCAVSRRFFMFELRLRTVFSCLNSIYHTCHS